MIILTTNDINVLIKQYLYKNKYLHTYFTFINEIQPTEKERNEEYNEGSFTDSHNNLSYSLEDLILKGLHLKERKNVRVCWYKNETYFMEKCCIVKDNGSVEVEEAAVKKENEEEIAKDSAEIEKVVESKEESRNMVKDMAEAERVANNKEESKSMVKDMADKVAINKRESDNMVKDKAEADRIANNEGESKNMGKDKAESEVLAINERESDNIVEDRAEAESNNCKRMQKLLQFKDCIPLISFKPENLVVAYSTILESIRINSSSTQSTASYCSNDVITSLSTDNDSFYYGTFAGKLVRENNESFQLSNSPIITIKTAREEKNCLNNEIVFEDEVLCADTSGSIFIVNNNQTKVLKVFDSACYEISFCDAGYLCGSADGKVKLVYPDEKRKNIENSTTKNIGHNLYEHKKSVNRLTYHHPLTVSSSSDYTTIIHNNKDKKKQLLRLHKGSVNDHFLSSTSLYSVSSDCTMKVYDIAKNVLTSDVVLDGPSYTLASGINDDIRSLLAIATLNKSIYFYDSRKGIINTIGVGVKVKELRFDHSLENSSWLGYSGVGGVGVLDIRML